MNDTPAVGIDITGIGLVEVQELRGDVLTVLAPVVRPPGSRIILCRVGCGEALAEGKVVSVAVLKNDPPRWRLTLKVFSLSRAVREVLRLAYQKNVPPR
jgi:hypothetical protein